MSVRRIVLPAVSAACSLFFLAMPSAATAADNEAAGATQVALKEMARGLESPSFSIREATSGRLINAQASAVPVTLAVAKEGNLEAAVRAVGILEAIYMSADAKTDGSTIDGAEFALDELARTGRPSVAERADVILESHYDIRERRVVAEIQRFHGVPKYGLPGDPANGWNPRFNPVPAPVDRAGDAKDKGELTWLIIGPKWTGGDEGLKQVARLQRLQVLYRIQGSPVSDEAVGRLHAAIPGLRIEVRGAAKLGITHGGATFGNERGCVVTEVQEGEAAANAGLRPQDKILRFGGHEVGDFYALVDLLRNYRPGEVVDTEIVRDDQEMIVPITLTGWD